jgi:hypothetical protein
MWRQAYKLAATYGWRKGMAHETNELIKAPPSAHRRRDAIAIAQVVLPVFAILAALGFGVAEWLARGSARYSPGPLAAVHSQWDNQCGACHESSQPLAAQNWLATISRHDHVADAKCQSCHAGPPHHASQKAGEVPGCTACHHDHLGVPGRLLAVADSHCTSCHRDLASHFVPEKTGERPRYGDVGHFAANHPEFALLRDKKTDPGTIAFNHSLHLIPGMGRDPSKPGPFTLKELAEEDRERYRKPEQKTDDLVILDCRSCHQTDAGDFVQGKGDLSGLPMAALDAARASGATMAPIVYERHCRACHPLTIDRQIPGDAKSELLTIRHRTQPKEILESLKGHYTNLLLRGLWQPQAPPLTLLPGKPAEKQKRIAEIDELAAASALKLLLAREENILEKKALGQTTCQKCHPSLDPGKGIAQTVPPAGIPTVWFAHARFDHTAHRAVDCRECHVAAFNGGGDMEQKLGSTNSSDVMLPGIATCLKCHSPAHGAGASATGGARHDCIACHWYHHGDNPLQGRGSRARLPLGDVKTITDFLSGK